MKLFISWSKPRSNQVAILLREWIPGVIQRVEPWMSSEDIEKGQRWGVELSELLTTTSQGIMCVTADNMREPWLSFEAGALAKSVTVARVRPVLLDVTPSDVTGPLAQFQATSLTDKADVFKLMTSLNSSTERPMDARLLTKSFERSWAEFDAAIGELARVSAGGAVRSVRQPAEKIDEILDLVRNIERRNHAVRGRHMSTASGDVVVDFSEVDAGLGANMYSVSDFETVSAFLDQLYLIVRDFVPPYTFGTQWELYDVKRNIALQDLGSHWSSRHDQTRDRRSLAETGVHPGMILAARLIATEPQT